MGWEDFLNAGEGGFDFSSTRESVNPLESLFDVLPGASSDSMYFRPDTWAPLADISAILGVGDSGSSSDTDWLSQISKAFDWATNPIIGGDQQVDKNGNPIYDQRGKPVMKPGISPLGAVIGGLGAIDRYRTANKQAKMAKQLYDTQMQWAQEDRARKMAGQKAQDVLNSPFDVQVAPRVYQPISPLQAVNYGRVKNGVVDNPSMYDRSLPTVTVLPRDTVQAAANPLQAIVKG